VKHNKRSALSERYSERHPHLVDCRSFDEGHERSYITDSLECLGKARGEVELVIRGGEYLRDPFDQRVVGTND